MESSFTVRPKENTIGRKLADPMAVFWEDGAGPSHAVIDRRFTLAGVEIPEGPKATKVFNAFLSANDGQALLLLDGLLETLRKYSGSELHHSPSGRALHAIIESIGISVSDDFQIEIPSEAQLSTTRMPRNDDTKESGKSRESEVENNPFLTQFLRESQGREAWGDGSGIHSSGSQSVRFFPEPTEFTDQETQEIQAAKRNVAPPKEIFLVHGHDMAALGEVERFVRADTGVTPIILSEQTNGGRTLIEKFEHYSTNAAYAIIIMTPDDVGRAVKEPEDHERARARENVVFEMGYFYGKLGRKNVSVLSFGPKLPGDINGLVYISRANWKYELAKELAVAGFKA